MKYRIEIENLESIASEKEIENALDSLMCEIAENYGDVYIDVTEEDEE